MICRPTIISLSSGGGEHKSFGEPRSRSSKLPFWRVLGPEDAAFPDRTRCGGINLLQVWINSVVSFCIRHFRLVIAAALLLGLVCGIYAAGHFSIDTNTDDLLSAKLPWRQQEIAFREAFPQTVDLILVDVGATAPEAAEFAARDVRQALSNK